MKKIYRVGYVRIDEWKSENSLGRFIEKYGDYDTREEAAKAIREMDIDAFWKKALDLPRTMVIENTDLDFVANHDSEDPDYPWIETRLRVYYHYDDDDFSNSHFNRYFRYRIMIAEIPSL